MLEDPGQNGKIKNTLSFKGTGLKAYLTLVLCSRRRIILKKQDYYRFSSGSQLDPSFDFRNLD
jgi:hypothetical protein